MPYTSRDVRGVLAGEVPCHLTQLRLLLLLLLLHAAGVQVPVIQLLGHVWMSLVEGDTSTVAAVATPATPFGAPPAAAAAAAARDGSSAAAAALPGMLAYLSGEAGRHPAGAVALAGACARTPLAPMHCMCDTCHACVAYAMHV
jgi:hypothetical protein